MRKNKPAFTIIELLVVLGVVAAISGVGIAAMVGFRRTVQLQGATAEFVSTLRTVQNMARTATLSKHVIDLDCINPQTNPLCRRPDGFALYFEDEYKYSIRYCVNASLAGEEKLTCGIEDENSKPEQYKEIRIYPLARDINKCRGIVFKRLTGEIYGIATSTLADPVMTGACEIDIEITGTGVGSKVIIDFVENSIRQAN